MKRKYDHSDGCICLAWKPILAGTLVAVGLSFLLNLFSVAIGLTAYTTSSEGVESLAFGGLFGTGIGIIAAMFAAGWIAGYLGQRHCPKAHLGALYGFLTWCLALLVAVIFASSVQHYLVFYSHFLSGTSEMRMMIPPAAHNMAVAVAHMPTNNLVISTYVMFALFFLSAFSSSLGGNCGMRYVCKK